MPTRYSQLYARGDTLARDSQRMRRRLDRLIRDSFDDRQSLALGRLVERECGIDIVSGGYTSVFSDWGGLFQNGELRDLFDTLFFAYGSIADYNNRNVAFLQRASRILDEESVGYAIDENGVVHPRVDDAFELARRSLISGLNGQRFAAARQHLEAVDRAMLQNPSDGRTAIRRVFDVVENIFKQSFEGETHVNSRALLNKLKPAVERKYSSNAQERNVAHKLFDGLQAWVNAAHFYRHEAGMPEPDQPSEMTTIALVSHGYSHARWLLEVVSNEHT